MPIFLWLLPLIGIPLFIILLNQRNIITLDFGTLRFLKILESESIRKLKLLQLILLILRTIIIILIIFMISRPVLTERSNFMNSRESSLHAIILDDSFSLQGNSEIIHETSNSILEQIPDKAHVVWTNINKGVQYKGLNEDMMPVDNLVTFTYHKGNLTDGLNILKQNIENEFAFKEVYIITDSQRESIENLCQYSGQFEDMHIYAIVASQLNSNLAITSVEVISEVLLPNHSIDIKVSVRNTGKSRQKNNLLQLIIDDMSVGQQLITIPEEETQTFLFTTALPATGLYKAIVELDVDDREEDNRYYFYINIPDQHNISLISNSHEESFYIQKSIDALNKSGESIIISEHISLDDPDLDINNHDALIILSPSKLEGSSIKIIHEHLYNGGHLIIVPDVIPNPVTYSNINSLAHDIEGNYQDLILIEHSHNSFQEIDLSSIKIKEIDKLFISNAENKRNNRLFRYFQLPKDPSYSQMLLNDGSAVWNRHYIYNGMIDIFAFPMHMDWSNFPIKGTFLPFIHFMIISRIQGREMLAETIGNQWEIIPEDYYPSTIFHVLPDGSREIINFDDNNYLIVNVLEHPGFHTIQTNGVVINHIAVNIDKTELNSNYIPIEELHDKAPDNMQFIPMEKDIMTVIKQARIGFEIWRYILYLIIVLVMIEMLISNVKRQK